MKILVVKTCDGDVYYREDRRSSRARAVELAAIQILDYGVGDLTEEDRAIVKADAENDSHEHLFNFLVEEGAIRVEELRS